MSQTEATAPIAGHIPIPSRCKHPWLDLHIGQSFHVSGEGESFLRQMRVQAARAGKRYGKRYVTRKDVAGIRIWRIE